MAAPGASPGASGPVQGAGDPARAALREPGVDRFGNVPSGFDGPASDVGAPSAGFGGSGGPAVLEPKVSPLGKLVGIVLIALFWNGIVSVFVWQLVKSWRAGSPDGCLTLFLIPFVLVGLVLLLGIPYQFLALFNPRPRLVLTPGRLVLGSAADLAWSFRGKAGRIQRLVIKLEGQEEADYTRGTDRVTAKEVFATIPLVDTALQSSIAAGSTRIEVPADTMHSFAAPDNRIVWTLLLQGTIRMWPDVKESLPVVIAPRPVEDGE